MRYQEFLPAPALRPYVRKYGILEQPFEFENPITAPTPPSLIKGVMLHFRRDGRLFLENGTFCGELPRGFVMTQAFSKNLWTYDRPWSLFAVILQPGQFRRFFPFSTVDLTDYLIRLEELEYPGWLHLHEQICLAPDHTSRISLADTFLLGLLPRLDLAPSLTDHFLHNLFHSIDKPIQELARDLYISERQFRRKFQRDMGMSPKKYQRLFRFSKGFFQLTTQPFDKLSDIAYSCGYYDQNEYIKEFKFFTGSTPGQYIKQSNSFAESIQWRERLLAEG